MKDWPWLKAAMEGESQAKLIYNAPRGGSGHVCKDAGPLKNLHMKEVRRLASPQYQSLGLLGNANAN